MARYIKSIEKAGMVLEAFFQDHELGISEIVEITQLNKSTVFDIVTTLTHMEYLNQNPVTKRYYLGIKLFELGNLYIKRNPLKNRSEPYANQLAKKYNATIHLATFDKGEVVYIEKYMHPDAFVNYSQAGKRAPLTCTGVGKAMLAQLSDEYKNEFVYSKPLAQLTNKSITDKEVLENDLALTRQRGYAIDDEEIELGLKCVAAPIFNENGEIIAAMSVSKLAPSMTEDTIPVIAEQLIKATKAISYVS
ncbi:IclR family transcriptional regulator [Fundicoccus culcitae]|uniref:IclR family transcriptional regulator n=1 Tax=Fundicoccus culcitae TaxID=2969821 RepID=A0ABY5P767_9LACT|nr:IclR family transcriptional regulator [Fundicoccus culcitae]UUX34215.1 IclR family transcriptional regulator [Fundicoccus culcitae]